MMEVLFKERQKFRQWWLWAILVVASLLAIWPMYIANEHLVWPVILPILILTSSMLLLFYVMELRTMVKTDGIYYQFYPIHFKYKKVTWDDLESFYIRKYNPIKEYGGWGIRFGFNGKAYNVSGDMGLQLTYKNGKKLLLGTQKPGELDSIIEDLKLDLDLQKHTEN
ncbi:MAG: hypothetical protein ACPGJS_21190 [Flammeovirgaceae bacterium]